MHEDVKRVELIIPATPEYVVLARLMVAGIASRMGMSYDDIEDLRVMAAEACRLLVGENGREGTLTFHCAVGPDGIEIDATGQTDPPASPPDDDDLSVLLLSSLADEHDVTMGAGGGRVRVVKRRAP